MENGQMMDMIKEEYKFLIIIQCNLVDLIQVIEDFGIIEVLIIVTSCAFI